jgi:hypothetical protein
VFPSKFSQVLAIKDDDPGADFESLQRVYLGVDWISAGEWLADRWHLPEFIGKSMRGVIDSDANTDEGYDVQLVRSSFHWLNGLPTSECSEPRLRQDTVLSQIPGLNQEALDVIEEKFLDQCEELHSLAANL